MKMCGTFNYLGVSSFTGKDNTVYNNLALLQETEVQKVFLKPEDLSKLNGLNNMDTVDVELDIKIGTKTFVNLISIKKAVVKAA